MSLHNFRVYLLLESPKDTISLHQYARHIEFLNEEIKNLEKEIASEAAKEEYVAILMSMSGIDYYSAMLIASEIGDINRFADSHHLCSYAGLVPSVHSSGGTTHYGKITKSGSRHLRWILTECVHAHVRYEKSNLSRFYEKIAKKKGKAKATVATASKMLRVIYWMLKEDREYRDIS